MFVVYGWNFDLKIKFKLRAGGSHFFFLVMKMEMDTLTRSNPLAGTNYAAESEAPAKI